METQTPSLYLFSGKNKFMKHETLTFMVKVKIFYSEKARKDALESAKDIVNTLSASGGASVNGVYEAKQTGKAKMVKM